jgi:hypothetical protein
MGAGGGSGQRLATDDPSRHPPPERDSTINIQRNSTWTTYNGEQREILMATKLRQKDTKQDDLWSLEDAELRNKIHQSFKIPSREIRDGLKPGYFAKLIFMAVAPPSGERMWVEITKKTKAGYVGLLRNDPVTPPLRDILFHGSEVGFGPEHICGVTPPDQKDG